MTQRLPFLLRLAALNHHEPTCLDETLMPNSPTATNSNFPEFDESNFELRYDAIHQWPVIFAPARAKRPFEFNKGESNRAGENDPFAEGNEGLTPHETLAIRHPDSTTDGPGWQVRIIPNKYPAIVPASEAASNVETNGVHEVIIECPQSETSFTRLGLSQIKLVFQSYRNRLRELAKNEQALHATIFKNHGPAAGASMSHCHSQLMATAYTPPHIQRELSFTTEHFKKTNRDYFGEFLLNEQTFRKRIVAQSDDFLVICPEASRFCFEMHIYPRTKEIHFHQTKDKMLNSLANEMLQSLKRLEKVAANPGYNFVLHTAPFKNKQTPGFRWHWEIYPRLSGIAGWELGTGGYVNPLFPETAAKLLREVELD